MIQRTRTCGYGTGILGGDLRIVVNRVLRNGVPRTTATLSRGSCLGIDLHARARVDGGRGLTVGPPLFLRRKPLKPFDGDSIAIRRFVSSLSFGFCRFLQRRRETSRPGRRQSLGLRTSNFPTLVIDQRKLIEL